MIQRILVCFAFISLGCSERASPETGRTLQIEKDERPPFLIDPAQPFRIEFGRGSGLSGLDTVKIDQDGLVILHRYRTDHQQHGSVKNVESTSLRLDHEVLSRVLEAIRSNDLMGLQRAYHASNLADGTQWVLLIKQGEREKSVYFNNVFPNAITRFAAQLDSILAEAGVGNLSWEHVPGGTSRRHERDLWDSIK